MNSYKNLDDSYVDHFLRQHIIPFRNSDVVNPHNDYEWVEVQRSKNMCLFHFVTYRGGEVYRNLSSKYFEGLSYGWPAGVNEFNKRTLQPYGCWFYMLRGSGMYVNIGKTLVALNRTDAMIKMGINTNQSSSADYHFCRRLIERGYDSLQIFNSLDPHHSELVICTGGCITTKVASACVPIEVRTGWNATKPCNCNDSYPILNCNQKITDELDCIDTFRKNPGMVPINKASVKQSCFYEDFEWNNNEFKSSSEKVNVLFTRRHSRSQQLTYLSKVVKTFRDEGHTILVDIGHSSYQGNLSNVLEEMNFIGYDVVSMAHHLENEGFFQNSQNKYIFSMLSLFLPQCRRSTIINRGNIRFGFIAYSLHNNMDIDSITQLVLDEALCLKRLSDIIILLSDGGLQADQYISRRLNKYVDVVLGNSHVKRSCNGKFHMQHENIIVHSSNNITSNVGLITFEIINKDSYYLKSDIIG